jgi:hypothetical protein
MWTYASNVAILTFIATNVPSEVNHKSSERVDKHTDAALPPTELDTPSYTHFTVNLYATTQTTLSNTSHSTY